MTARPLSHFLLAADGGLLPNYGECASCHRRVVHDDGAWSHEAEAGPPVRNDGTTCVDIVLLPPHVPVLVSTDDAAALVGVEPQSFRQWAQTRGLRASRHVRAGRSIRALWDADLVYEAERLKPTSTWGGAGRRG